MTENGSQKRSPRKPRGTEGTIGILMGLAAFVPAARLDRGKTTELQTHRSLSGTQHANYQSAHGGFAKATANLHNGCDKGAWAMGTGAGSAGQGALGALGQLRGTLACGSGAQSRSMLSTSPKKGILLQLSPKINSTCSSIRCSATMGQMK